MYKTDLLKNKQMADHAIPRALMCFAIGKEFKNVDSYFSTALFKELLCLR